MMAEVRQNGIIGKLDEMIRCGETSEQERVQLLCMRDIYCMVRDHLQEHNRWGTPLRQILTAVITAAATTYAVRVLLGQ